MHRLLLPARPDLLSVAVLLFAASWASFISNALSLGHGGPLLRPSSSSWRPLKASLVTGADEPSIARETLGASHPPRPSSLVLGAGFAVRELALMCKLGPGSNFSPFFCSSWSWIHPSWSLPTLSSLLGMDRGADLPSQAISPSFPQKSFGEGPRRSTLAPVSWLRLRCHLTPQ